MIENEDPHYDALKALLFSARVNTFAELGEREL